MTTDDKALSFVPQILDAHDKALSAQRSGFKSSLDHAIDAGELLEKAKETVGSGWTKWREQHLPKIPQTTASLYMRLAKNKDKLSTTAVSNAVANLGSEGKLSLRQAAALVVTKQARGNPKPKASDQDAAITFLKRLEAVDECVAVLRLAYKEEYLHELSQALAPVKAPPIRPPLQQAATSPVVERRL